MISEYNNTMVDGFLPINDSSLSVGGFENQAQSSFFRRIAKKEEKNILTDQQNNIVDEINHRIHQDGHASYRDNSMENLTSSMFEKIEDLSKLEVKIYGGLADFDGKLKSKYKSSKYMKSICYTGYEMLSILKRLEFLESLVESTSSKLEIAKQIYEIIGQKYSAFPCFDEKNDFLFRGLRGITCNNSICREQLNCMGYAQLYKELCNRFQISCDVVSGEGIVSGKTGRHVWNVVLLNGEEIPVDCAWHSSDGLNWFDSSDEFQKTHIADDDEKFKDYSVKGKHNPVNQKISHIITTMDGRNGVGSGTYGLIRYLATKEENSITRCDGARDLLKEIKMADIEHFFMEMERDVFVGSVMRYIKDQMVYKYGPVEGLEQFNLFLNTKDTSYITRFEGARDFANKWLKEEDIESYSKLN